MRKKFGGHALRDILMDQVFQTKQERITQLDVHTVNRKNIRNKYNVL